MRRGNDGRAKTLDILKSQLSPDDKTIWFHCASLGEYEQGLPVFQEIRSDYPDHKIVLSFFSPSGYDIRKNAPIADTVVYLPLDTKTNAKTFIDLVNPELVLFVKYEIWPNYLKVLKARRIKTLLISALFRKGHIYFKWYGKLMRSALSTFEHIFVQDEASKKHLETIGFANATVSGDTRFDRVSDQLKTDNTLPDIEAFISNETCIVAGSTWPEDDSLLIEFINSSEKAIKLIIAPHNIKSKQIQDLQNKLTVSSVLFSEKNSKTLSDYKVLIIDSIGILSKVYSYANIAYVGGAVGSTGLHNILEPAVFGIPIIIGNNYQKFPEAVKMLKEEGVFSIINASDLKTIFNNLIENEVFRHSSGEINSNFIKENCGAVIQIMDYIRK